MTFFFNKLWQAFLYSWNGLCKAWQSEWAFRVELILLLIALPAAFLLKPPAVEYILLIGAILLIIIVELLNSAIETAINRISQERHELSGLAKDLASAAVLIACVNAGFIWLVVIVSHSKLVK